MTTAAHAIIGATIVTKIPDLRIALPLVLISHFVADMPAHWDTGTNWQKKGLKRVFWDTVADVLIGFALVFIIFVLYFHLNPVTVYLGVFVSQLPDYLEFPYFFLHWHFAPWTWVNGLQHFFHKKIPWLNFTLVNQIIISTLFVLLASIK